MYQSPQPNADDIFTILRYYATLKCDPSYQKRITAFENGTHAVAEYLGTLPAAVQPHGLAHAATGEYVRTQPALLDDICL